MREFLTRTTTQTGGHWLMRDWEGCTADTIGLPNPNQRSVGKRPASLHPYIYRYTARAFLREILGSRG